MRLGVAATTILLLSAAGEASATETPLAFMQGDWTAEGVVEGEKANYDARGEFVLGGRWMRLTLSERDKVDGYTAHIYIGVSKEKGDLVAHWLDNFGADGARITGQGQLTKTGWELAFGYEDSLFRDIATRNADGSFRLVIDACDPVAKAEAKPCERFADYIFQPAR